MKAKKVASVIIMAWGMLRSVPAELLIYEGFEYGTQTAPSEWNGGTGLAGSWSHVHQPGSHAVDLVTGLSFGRLEVSGNALRMESASDEDGPARFSKLQRALDIPQQESGEIWMSYLISRTSGHSSGANAVRVMDQGGSTRDFTTEYKSFNVSGRPRLHLRGVNTTGTASTPNRDRETMLVIARYEVGRDAASAEMWILDEFGFGRICEKIDDGTLSGTDLEEHSRYYLVLEGGGTTVLCSRDVIEFFQQTKFTAANDGGLAAVYDELRIGTDLSTVIPITEKVEIVQKELIFISGCE